MNATSWAMIFHRIIFTSLKDGGFYGWPYSYIGDNVDPRVKPQRPDLVRARSSGCAARCARAPCNLLLHWEAVSGKLSGRCVYAEHGSWTARSAGISGCVRGFRMGSPRPILCHS